MAKILVAGASGYLGKYIVKELEAWEIPAVAVVRSAKKLNDLTLNTTDIIEAEVTKPETIRGVCEGIDAVISTVGITRQLDGLTYRDVDYQANLNLLNEAKQSGVRKFIYVSVIDGEMLRHLKMVDAKERFVDALKDSGMGYTIIRPNGFYSDLEEILQMASRGRVYLFGDGEFKLNPIHGADLAEVCVRAIAKNEKEIRIGGPDILTQNEIAGLALSAMDKSINIVHMPDWIRRLILSGTRMLTDEDFHGPIEFFLTLIARDNIAERYGTRRLNDYFNQKAHTKMHGYNHSL